MSEASLGYARFGAVPVGNGRTRFCVWAPSSREAQIVFGDRGELAMNPEPGGWFCAESDCAPGTTYQYRFDGNEPVPDPASRAQQGGVDGPSMVVDPSSYCWEQSGWRGRPWNETVIYELHAGCLGGYVGVRRILGRLVDLGITAIELMPLAESPGRRNWGYDGVLPFAPNSAYGSLDELKELIDAAHGCGLMVFLDVVYNHFGPQGNHLASYADEFFRDDVTTPWGRAIDFRRDEVREFYIANALYWLEEYRFDGLRLDAVHAIAPNNWLPDLASRVRAGVSPGRHVHLVVENDANDADLLQHGFDAQWNDDFHHALHVMLTGEHESYYRDYARAPAAALARCLADGFAYQGEYSIHRGATRGQPSRALAPVRFVSFLQNHDQVGNRACGERLTMLANPDALHAATALLLLAPSIPLLWMGEEWDSRTPFFYFTDYSGPLAEAVREGRRREFAAFALFRDPQQRQAIPDPNDEETFTRSIPDFGAATQVEGACALARCRELLAIRRREIIPFLDGAQSIGARVLEDVALTAGWRLGDARVLTIWVNLGPDDVSFDPAGPNDALYQTTPGVDAALASGTLPAHSLLASLSPSNRDV